MEGQIPKPSQIGFSVDSADEGKYLSGLSTILVATIQEAKDRISQIEYIFCSQLFPNFQSRLKSLQKIYSDARKVSEDEWKKKENHLLLQLERLQNERQRAMDESNALKLEKEKLSKEWEENTNLQVKQLENLFRKKSKEVDEGMKLQQELIQLVQVKSGELVGKDKEMKERGEKINMLVVKLKELEKKVDELQEELSNKAKEVIKEKELHRSLLMKIESQELKAKDEHPSNDHEIEKKQLEAMVDNLRDELKKKTEEADEGRKLLEHLVDDTGYDCLENKQQLEGQKKAEKSPLMMNCFGENVDELQLDHMRSFDATDEKEAYEKLLQQIKLKDLELQSERKKTKDLISAYKSLKSQHNFLRRKKGLTIENMLPPNRVESDGNSLKQHYQIPTTSPGQEGETPGSSAVVPNTNQPKNGIAVGENLEGVKVNRSKQTTNLNKKSTPYSGTKRSTSCWRDTRTHRNRGGPDPHDDFLDTPLENIKENMNKTPKEDAPETKFELSDKDEEMQEPDAVANAGADGSRRPPLRPGTSGFKYVEATRKKAERETLKGIECKQCKKFYDAVLDDGNGDANGDKRNARCEHHDGVSRHRYRFVPPSTPEGFWNIGFDSEM